MHSPSPKLERIRLSAVGKTILLLLAVAFFGCCTRTFSREELNRWNPSKIDMQRAKPASREIQDFREGLWKGHFDDISRTRMELFINLTRADSILSGEFRLADIGFHSETIYSGHVNGVVSTGKVTFVTTITNGSDSYPIEFAGEWLTDTNGLQSMHGTINDTGTRFLLGGVWIAWHQQTK